MGLWLLFSPQTDIIAALFWEAIYHITAGHQWGIVGLILAGPQRGAVIPSCCSVPGHTLSSQWGALDVDLWGAQAASLFFQAKGKDY